MIKEYIIKYKVFSIPYYYEFIGIERFYIAAENKI